ncbi:hypothetical protein TL16_g08156 [Triparma laevis f. inornata]|uniref:Uncharacterized protein n=1 Tax=Triparma laevis f. inornata TaxID=1714386 RepID=A0A9W7EJR7_9STRA|nr:hypothetical protein TL16_g08156 [Triparma laevis f. inornata]
MSNVIHTAIFIARSCAAAVFFLYGVIIYRTDDFSYLFSFGFPKYYWSVVAVLSLGSIAFVFDGNLNAPTGYQVYHCVSSVLIALLHVLVGTTMWTMPDADVIRFYRADGMYFAGICSFIAGLSLLDVYLCVVFLLNKIDDVYFFLILTGIALFSLFTHANILFIFLVFRRIFLSDEEEAFCEDLLENFFEKAEGETGFQNEEKILSPPLLPIRNKISTVLHGGSLFMTHCRSLRSLLYIDCLLPGLGAVQRTKSTRSLLIGHAAHMSLSFHEDRETFLLRKRIINLDSKWWYQCRAAFVIAMERLVRGFPMLWSPNEEFFRICEDRVHKRTFQKDVAIKFYLVDARNNPRLDLQPYLLKDLRVDSIKTEAQAEEERRASLFVHDGHHSSHVKKTVTLFIPIKVLPLNSDELEKYQEFEKNISSPGGRISPAVASVNPFPQSIFSESCEDALTSMALWDAMPYGQLSPVKAGRLAATSYMRHFVFRGYHEKQKKASRLVEKMTSMGHRTLKKQKTTRKSSASVTPVISDTTLMNRIFNRSKKIKDDATSGRSGHTFMVKQSTRRNSLTQGGLSSEVTELPYRNDNKTNALKEAQTNEALEKTPENVLAALCLTGLIKQDDLTQELTDSFKTEDTMKICKSSILDQVSHQRIPFVTTDVNTTIQKEITSSKNSWEKSSWLTVIVFTLIDAFAILLTIADDFSHGPVFLQRLNLTFKYVSVVLLVVLSVGRVSVTRYAVSRMAFALDQISSQKNLRLASVLQDHIGFDLNFYMSICSMVYLYGRGIPGCIINASFFLFMINEKRQSSQDENELVDAASCHDYGMELATIAAMILSFITALSYSKAKLLGLYHTQSSVLQTVLSRIKMDNITDLHYKASVLSDPTIISLPDLEEPDNGLEHLSAEIDNIQRVIKSEQGFGGVQANNAYDNTMNSKTRGTKPMGFDTLEGSGSRTGTRTKTKTKGKGKGTSRGAKGGSGTGRGSLAFLAKSDTNEGSSRLEKVTSIRASSGNTFENSQRKNLHKPVKSHLKDLFALGGRKASSRKSGGVHHEETEEDIKDNVAKKLAFLLDSPTQKK